MVLVVCPGFWLFLGFYSGFELLTTKTTVQTKKNHEFWILRDNLKIVFIVLVFLGLYSGFGGLLLFWWLFLVFTVVFVFFLWLLVVFREFYNTFGD